MFVDVNGVKLGYSDLGEGPPILLVHGFPLNRSMWDPQVGTLRSLARVIAPDLRGFGASDAGPPGPLSMEQHADDLAELLRALDVREPVVFCGLSMGGYVAFAFWRRHPELVRAFVLMDTRASADTEPARAHRLALAEQVERARSPSPVVEDMMPRLFAPSVRRDTALAQRVEAMMAGTSPRGVADGQRGMAARPDSLGLLETIDVPTLVLVGEQDALTPPAESERIAAGIPGASLKQVPLAGHMSNMENPDEVNQLLQGFVSRALAGGGT